MTDRDDLLRRVRGANPAPSALDLPAGLADARPPFAWLIDGGKTMAATEATSPPHPRWRVPVIVAGALAVTLAVAVPLLLVFRGGEEAPVATTPTTVAASTTTPAVGTTQPPVATTAATTTTSAPATTTLPPIPVPAMAWERLPDQPGVEFGRMQAVVAGGPGLVAVGSAPLGPDPSPDGSFSAAVWVSADGRSWERLDDPDLSAVEGGLLDVTQGPEGLVAVGGWEDHAEVWVSADGLDWTRVEDEDLDGPGGIYAVAAGPSGLVAVGGDDLNALVWASPDGTSWARVEDESLLAPGGAAQGRARMFDVWAGGPGWVAVGWGSGFWEEGIVALPLRPGIWVSADGLAWDRVPDAAIEGFADLAGDLQTVGPGPDGGLIAWFNASQVRYSADGLAWRELEGFRPAAEGAVLDVVRDGDRLIGVGLQLSHAAGVWASLDGGLTWGSLALAGSASTPAESGAWIAGITLFGSEMVAVGGSYGTSYGYDRAAAIWVGTWDEG